MVLGRTHLVRFQSKIDSDIVTNRGRGRDEKKGEEEDPKKDFS